MENEVLGKMSEQKEAWEKIWNRCLVRLLIFYRWETETWGQTGGWGGNSHTVQIAIHFPDLIDHDFLNSKYKAPN